MLQSSSRLVHSAPAGVGFRRRFLRSLLIACLLAFAAVAPAWAGIRIDMDGDWRFRTDADGKGQAHGWSRTLPEDTRTVRVPHTWGVGEDAEFLGTAWYFKTFPSPAAAADARVELHFGAAFYRARVWLNGVEVGTHEGGHSTFRFDVSTLLRRDGENFLAVAVDNRPGPATLPGYAQRLAGSGSVWYDWWPYGGLVRDVWLSVHDGGVIRRQALRSELAQDHARATVTSRLALENPGRDSRAYVVDVALLAPDGREVATASGGADIAAGGHGEVALTLAIDKPELWNVGDGRVYEAVAKLRDGGGRLLDVRRDTFGVRRIEIRDRHLLVNGRRVRLTGLTRHEDSPWEGLAETRGTIVRDYDDLRALHTTLTRPAHYPQHSEVLDYADRHGILLIPEIPMWQFSEAQMKDPRVLALAGRMLEEMIAQDGNHPSVFAWSLCNESDARLPGGLAYIEAMKARVRELDPDRFVTFADADLSVVKPWPDMAAAHAVDFLMANAYFGTWSGAEDEVEPWLDFMDRTYPDKLVIVSEFGYPGPFSRNPEEADRRRIENFTSQMEAFQRRDFVAGAILWTYQDYKSHRNLWTGQTSGYVDHGLVDEYRQRKPSYAAWETLTRPLQVRIDWNVGEKGLRGFAATLQRNGPERLPSYPLENHRVRWDVLDQQRRRIAGGERVLPSLERAVRVDDAWKPVPELYEATLRLTVEAPDGTEVARIERVFAPLRFGSALFPGNE